MNARSALFDLYGDHLVRRGGRGPVAGLVRLMAPLGIAAPAVRTAISRMVRQGWLTPVRVQGAPGYEPTPMAGRRLDDAAARVYGRRDEPWDGSWHLVLAQPVRDRATRERLRAGLAFLGYAPLGEATWVGARRSTELDALLAAERVRAETFRAAHDGESAALVARAWNLDALARTYRDWVDETAALIDSAGQDPDDETAFVVRSRLVHAWRQFLHRDPALPAELLPMDWPGRKAREMFDAEERRLLPAADRFVDAAL